MTEIYKFLFFGFISVLGIVFFIIWFKQSMELKRDREILERFRNLKENPLNGKQMAKKMGVKVDPYFWLDMNY